MNNESPAALLPCPFCAGNAAFEWGPTGRYVCVECSACGAIGGEISNIPHDADRDALREQSAAKWNRRASTAPDASESRWSVPNGKVVPYGSASGEKDYGYGYEKGYADGWNACRDAVIAADPTPPAVSNGEPTAEHWKQAAKEIVRFFTGTLLSSELAKMESLARELARSAAAKGEG